MAVKYMTSINIPGYDKNIKNTAWEYREELLTSSTGDSIIMPISIQNIGIQLIIQPNNAAKIQYTLDLLSNVITDNAVWIDWELGEIGLTNSDSLFPVTAIRHVCVVGNSIMTIRAV